MTIGEVIRQARLTAGLTQTELGDRLGKSARQVGRYESDAAELPLQAGYQIATELGIPLAQLIDGVADDAPHRDLDMSGSWHRAWKAWHDQVERIEVQSVEITEQRHRLDLTDDTTVRIEAVFVLAVHPGPAE